MGLQNGSRIGSIDVLRIDYEYCKISYYSEGDINDFGEPSRTLTQRATNVKCSIDPLIRLPTHISQSGRYEVLVQGIETRSVHLLVVNASVSIEPGDVVEDDSGLTYDVIHVVNWQTHKEAFMISQS